MVFCDGKVLCDESIVDISTVAIKEYHIYYEVLIIL